MEITILHVAPVPAVGGAFRLHHAMRPDDHLPRGPAAAATKALAIRHAGVATISESLLDAAAAEVVAACVGRRQLHGVLPGDVGGDAAVEREWLPVGAVLAAAACLAGAIGPDPATRPGAVQ